MIDLKLLRTNPELYKDSAKKRWSNVDIDAFLVLDKEVVKLKQEIDELRTIKNKVSREIPTLSNEEKGPKIVEMKKVWEELKQKEEALREKQVEFNEIYYCIPNLLDETAAIWATDEENAREYFFWEKTKFDFELKPHYEIGEKKGWIDIPKGSEVSGSRFWYLKWDLVFLQFAIVNFALSKLAEKWFSPVLPPVLVREKAMFWTWFFPADEDWIYSVNPWEDDLYLVGTAEVPVTSYHTEEVVNVDEPIKYVGYSPCFRREAGAAWKDTRWILRWHQFDKVEMVTFCKPEDSQKMHDEMVAIEEEIRQALNIPYQKMNVCTGDLWNPAMKKYDLEAWMPGQEKYREVTSCSNIWDFQSRRLNIKYRDKDDNLQFVHTLNGTVIALSRCLIAIIENYQDENGDVIIPEVLVPFMWGKTKI